MPGVDSSTLNLLIINFGLLIATAFSVWGMFKISKLVFSAIHKLAGAALSTAAGFATKGISKVSGMVGMKSVGDKFSATVNKGLSNVSDGSVNESNSAADRITSGLGKVPLVGSTSRLVAGAAGNVGDRVSNIANDQKAKAFAYAQNTSLVKGFKGNSSKITDIFSGNNSEAKKTLTALNYKESTEGGLSDEEEAVKEAVQTLLNGNDSEIKDATTGKMLELNEKNLELNELQNISNIAFTRGQEISRDQKDKVINAIYRNTAEGREEIKAKIAWDADKNNKELAQKYSDISKKAGDKMQDIEKEVFKSEFNKQGEETYSMADGKKIQELTNTLQGKINKATKTQSALRLVITNNLKNRFKAVNGADFGGYIDAINNDSKLKEEEKIKAIEELRVKADFYSKTDGNERTNIAREMNRYIREINDENGKSEPEPRAEV